MNVKNYHIDFKLNEKSFDSVESLLSFSNTISKDTFSFLENWFDDSDFVLIHTSGSTGKPKSIKVKKEHMVNSAVATGIYFDLKPKTTALLCLPMEYIAGKMMLVRSLILGWHLDIVKAASKPLTHVVKQYDFSAMIPMQLFNSIVELDKIKTIIVGGGNVNNKIKSRILDLPTKIYATYGMTETITHIAIKALNKASGLTSDNDLYYALPNVKLSKDIRNCLIIDAPEVSDEILITNDIVDLISDDKFKWLGRFDNIFKIKIIIVGAAAVSNEVKTRIIDLPTKIYATYGMTETITHIAVKALNKASGLTIDNDLYHALPNVKLSKDIRNCLIIDAPEVSDEILITNDIVDLISDDKFKWLGRFDNMINSGGIKLIPEQIEEKLQTIIRNRFFIASLPDDILGEKVVLIIEGSIQKNLKPRISNLKSIDKYEIPKEIYFVERFVMTETKKIQRKKTLDLIFT